MSQMRVYLLGLLILAGCSRVLADGAYVGGAIGTQSNAWRRSGQLDQLDQSYQVVHSTPFNSLDTGGGISGMIDLGYKSTLSPHFAYGLEMDAAMASSRSREIYTDSNNKGSVHRADQFLRFTLGASILPALRLTKQINLFFRVGLGVGQFKLSSSGFMYSLANSRNAVKEDNYGVFGVGLDVDVAKDWGLRMEYDYLDFASFPVDEWRIDDTHNKHQVKLYNYHARYRPHAMRVTVGFNRYFL